MQRCIAFLFFRLHMYGWQNLGKELEFDLFWVYLKPGISCYWSNRKTQKRYHFVSQVKLWAGLNILSAALRIPWTVVKIQPICIIKVLMLLVSLMARMADLSWTNFEPSWRLKKTQSYKQKPTQVRHSQ
jgi:hypothetical protein